MAWDAAGAWSGDRAAEEAGAAGPGRRRGRRGLPSTPRWPPPGPACRSWGASASPGSTTPTSTCAGPWPPACCWAARAAAAAGWSTWPGAAPAAGSGGRPAPRGRAAAGRDRRPGRRGRRSGRRPAAALPGRARACWCPTGTGPGGAAPRPLEQLVIDEQLRAARVPRPGLGVAAWVLPTLIAHGSAEQQERWIRPTLLGELSWCQLFSEPGAGSDLASLTTRAEQVVGGWMLTGQKVWTTLAHQSDWGICLARIGPSAPKHEGITYFVVDMKSAGPRHPPAARADRRRHVQRGVPHRRLRPRRVRGGPARRRVADRAHHPGQRAGVDVLGRHLRGGGRVGAAPPGRAGPVGPRRRRPRGGRLAGRGPVGAPARAPGHPALAVGYRPGCRLERAQAAGGRARAAGPGAGAVAPGARRGGGGGGGGAVGPGLPGHPLPDHRRGHQRGAAQRDGRAHAGPARATPSRGPDGVPPARPAPLQCPA